MKTAITGGTIVTAGDTIRADVLVEGERIVAIGEGLAAGADVVVDATGKLVLPGGIDVHTHMDMPFGGTVSIDDFETGHRAALHGGTTSHVDFVLQSKGGTLQEALDTWRAKADGKAMMDYGFHIAVTDARPEVIDELDAMVEQGVTSFKLFLAYPGSLMVDDDTLYDVMSRAARNGALVMLHAENGPVIQKLVEQALADGHTEPGWHYRTRPAALEGEATARGIAIADTAGAPLFIVHVTCEPAVHAIAEARNRGVRVWGETCTQYFYLTQDDLDRDGFEGAKFVCSPPLRTELDQQRLWQAVADGELASVSTDHCAFDFEHQKALGKDDFTRIPNGLPGIEERLSLLTTGVANGHLDWNRLVDVWATTPAKLFGMYPRKGTISVGADADVILVDPGATHTWSASNIHGAAGYTCFEGMQTTGRATHVWRRGELVVDDGEATPAMTPGTGRFVAREPFGWTSPTTYAPTLQAVPAAH